MDSTGGVRPPFVVGDYVQLVNFLKYSLQERNARKYWHYMDFTSEAIGVITALDFPFNHARLELLVRDDEGMLVNYWWYKLDDLIPISKEDYDVAVLTMEIEK